MVGPDILVLLFMQLTKLAAREPSGDESTPAPCPPSNCTEALLSVLMRVRNQSEALTLTELYSVSGHGLLKLTGMNSRPLTLVNWPWSATDRPDLRLHIDPYEISWLPNIITIKAQWSPLNKQRYLSMKRNNDGKPALSLQKLPSAKAYWKWEPVKPSGDPYIGKIAIQGENKNYYLGVKKNGTVFLQHVVSDRNQFLFRNHFLFRRCNHETVTVSNLGNYTYNTCWWTGPETMFRNIVEHCLSKKSKN